MSNNESLGWNPGRVLFGLSRIGYTPHSAIADIADNSVTYGADEVHIVINKEREELADSRKNNIREYLIIDNGRGMNSEGIREALKLGSDADGYDDNSLSKFGLGLKSASFSQGNILEVISSDDPETDFIKYRVDLSEITDDYFCTKYDLSDEDSGLLEEYLPSGVGTIIRISGIHQNNHPSLKKTTEELKYRLGTIYFYFLTDGLKLTLNGEEIQPYDVLFSEEANQNGMLNEHEWDGRGVHWIKQSSSQTLDVDAENPVQAQVEVTQLPHPPTFDLDGEGERKKVRDKYKIESGNYGYYVYRNKRLISWACKFDGIIPQDQDFYSFRGRILLDESADDAFNIDVKKSHIVLSDDAWDALSDLSDEYKRKSKKAWQHANAVKKQMLGEEPNVKSNDIAADLDLPEALAGDGLKSPEEEAQDKKREEDLKQKVKERIKEEAQQNKNDNGEEGEVTEEEIKEFASGGEARGDKRIFRVPTIEDNLLWEPYYEEPMGWCVRINQTHRFSRCIFEDNSENVDLQVFFELILLNLAQAEAHLRRTSPLADDLVEELIRSYRESFSQLVAAMMRKPDVKLPPL